MPKKYKYTEKFTVDGKQYKVYADTIKDLAFKKAMRIHAVEEGRTVLSKNTLFKDWAYTCMDTYKSHRSAITIRNFKQRIDHNLIPYLGEKKLHAIKPVDCQMVINLTAGHSQAHTDEVYHVLNFIMRKAVENKLVLENPAEGVIKPKGTRSHRRALTPEEQALVVQEAKKDRLYYLYLLMLGCGCRPAEAAECKGSDIETVSDNGQEYHILHIRGTKTDLSDRRVPIPDDIYEVIKDTPPDDYISCHKSGNKINMDKRHKTWGYFKYHLDIAAGAVTYRNKIIESKIAPDLVPYCLRHTYCTNLAKNGVDIRVAQKLMGHADISMTANIYTHVDNDDIVSAAKLVRVSPWVSP